MKTRIEELDVAVATVWIICLLCGRREWEGLSFALDAYAALLRVVLAFTLARGEKRSWMPLLAFAACWALKCKIGLDDGIITMTHIPFRVLGVQQNLYVNVAIICALYMWVVLVPFVRYAVMLCMGRLVRTEMKWTDAAGAIMWNDTSARRYSALLAITMAAVLTGKSMFAALSEAMCLSLAPLCYWLICRCQGVKASRLWLMVAGLLVFWNAQRTGGAFRVGLLLISFCMIAYVCIGLFRSTGKILLTGITAVWLAVLLPSLTIGYNQYACINYPRSGTYYLAPFRGILYIHECTGGELYGLRDRYGLLLRPEYDRIEMGKAGPFEAWCLLTKDGKTQKYCLY